MILPSPFHAISYCTRGNYKHRLSFKNILYRCGSSDSVNSFNIQEPQIVKTTSISLDAANQIANVAIHTAKQKKFNTSGAYPKYSYAKAFTAVSHNISSRAFRDKYIPATSTDSPDYRKLTQLLNMSSINEGKLATFPGGIVLRTKEDGIVIGAVGVSGASGDEDEYCAMEGAKAAGFDLV